jgi:hypothetical protein
MTNNDKRFLVMKPGKSPKFVGFFSQDAGNESLFGMNGVNGAAVRFTNTQVWAARLTRAEADACVACLPKGWKIFRRVG